MVPKNIKFAFSTFYSFFFKTNKYSNTNIIYKTTNNSKVQLFSIIFTCPYKNVPYIT